MPKFSPQLHPMYSAQFYFVFCSGYVVLFQETFA